MVTAERKHQLEKARMAKLRWQVRHANKLRRVERSVAYFRAKWAAKGLSMPTRAESRSKVYSAL